MMGVASRLLSVLDVIEQSGTALTASEIARRSMLSAATAWRLLQELAEWGGVERTEDGKYRIATRLWAIGGSAPCVRRLQRDTWTHLRQLSDSTGLAAGLVVLEDDEALLVTLSPGKHGAIGLREGDRVGVDDPVLGRIFAAAGTLNDSAIADRRLTMHRDAEGVAIAAGITNPAGATIAALGLFGRADAASLAAREQLLAAVAPVRFSIFREELFASR